MEGAMLGPWPWAIGSAIDLGALLIGAVIGIKMQRHFMDDHEVAN